jgi:hypothetical protein
VLGEDGRSEPELEPILDLAPSVAIASMQLLRDGRITREQYQQLIAQDRFYKSHSGKAPTSAYVTSELWYRGPISQKLRKTTILSEGPILGQPQMTIPAGTAGLYSPPTGDSGQHLLDALEAAGDRPQIGDFTSEHVTNWAKAMEQSEPEEEQSPPEDGEGLWENIEGNCMVASGGHLEKTMEALDGHDSGASSVEVISQHDHEVQGVSWTVGSGEKEYYIGLSHKDEGPEYWSIDFAIGCLSNRHIRIYESGLLKGCFGQYKAQDRFSIRLKGLKVSYHRNGIHMYTSEQPAQYPLVADTSFYSAGAAVHNLELVHHSLQSTSHTKSHGFVTPVNVLGSRNNLRGRTS